MEYCNADYMEAIKFALNYPPKVHTFQYDMYQDVFKILLMDGGWYDISLQGSFVRSCLKWKGIKQWTH